ncbi:hypothetical protein [Rhizobium ruizarguesonis]|uniref:hypothetical protein n=1 Tax=Rhizobium ruizarguesonis TaxID=2081791 RepID=UPI00102F97A8|nr:hypothetical protein [Rhizobium ruizarguesonis]NEI32169.1 hypothetical protein [Rhizobium ruizarguesonis]TBB79114.1 hypothetical protein ELH38_38425 [Rhizobium ruizarguesonis]
MTAALASEAKASGYQTSTVIARIMDMDVDAVGNTEKAAWKRYMGLALLAIAKSVDKKKLIEAIFGKGGKPSKTFQNMYSMADKARNTVLGNRSWDEVRAMPIDAAMDTVMMSINSHMSSLEVTSKNDYDKVCNLSPSEAADKREADKKAKAEAEAEAKAKAEADAAAAEQAEATAKAEAEAKPERDLVRETFASLQGAGPKEIAQIFGGLGMLLMELDRETMIAVHNELGTILANTAKDVTPGTAQIAA